MESKAQEKCSKSMRLCSGAVRGSDSSSSLPMGITLSSKKVVTAIELRSASRPVKICTDRITKQSCEQRQDIRGGSKGDDGKMDREEEEMKRWRNMDMTLDALDEFQV
ncbi:hypothetical protein DPX16_23198 [Anabarilius grahami]|uniref:Uncharacterized protein n=1 Tax=Anabarilius grahami TaxID=495550 RepID=A0A3N0YRL2_ANAGA|nr:hypothetical protein DPX16_23198 [Anabarilius grahami]